jgi:hypothetical protein
MEGDRKKMKDCPCQDQLRDESWEDFKKTRKYRELKKMFSKSQHTKAKP